MYYLKFLFLIIVAEVGTLLAGTPTSVASVNTFGIIRVESATANTLIAVPWTWYSEREEDALNILAKKLVKTENLEENDLLYRYLDDGTYRAWVVVEKNGEKSWEPCTTVVRGSEGTGSIAVRNDNDTTDAQLTWEPYLAVISDDDAVTKIARGNAVWLRRQHPTKADGTAKPFWVYGQSVSTPVSNTIAAPTGNATCATTLLGNPYAKAIKINELKFSAEPASTDRIFVPDGTLTPKTLMWNKSKRKWRSSYSVVVDGKTKTAYDYDVEVPAGLAFWYDRRGTTDLTITWDPPTESAAGQE